MTLFRNKTALITGAGSGIGRALALKLVGAGCNVALADLNEAGLQETAQLLPSNGTTVSLHVTDVTKEADLQRLFTSFFQAHANLDLLFNNAGITAGGKFQEMPSETFNRVMKVNFEAVVQLTRLFLPSLRTRPDARIINISSLYGLIGGRDQSAYSASKFAVTGFSSALRFDLADTSVKVQVVFPGGVKTAIVQNAIPPEGLTVEQVEKRKAGEQRLLRMSPDKAASIILSGVERNKFRILVGGDVVFMDRLARLFPQGYATLLKSLTKLRKLF